MLVHECFAEDVDDPAYEGSEEVVHLRGAIERYSQLMRGHAYAGVKQVCRLCAAGSDRTEPQ